MAIQKPATLWYVSRQGWRSPFGAAEGPKRLRAHSPVNLVPEWVTGKPGPSAMLLNPDILRRSPSATGSAVGLPFEGYGPLLNPAVATVTVPENSSVTAADLNPAAGVASPALAADSTSWGLWGALALAGIALWWWFGG
jgi:hypothetical protein